MKGGKLTWDGQSFTFTTFADIQRVYEERSKKDIAEAEFRRGYFHGWHEALEVVLDVLDEVRTADALAVTKEARRFGYTKIQDWMTIAQRCGCSSLENPPEFRSAEAWRTIVESNCARARYKGLPDTLTLQDWAKTLQYFDYSCAYCGGSADVLEHFIPVSRGGGTTMDNCVPACRSCNCVKGKYRPAEMDWEPWPERIKKVRSFLQCEVRFL